MALTFANAAAILAADAITNGIDLGAGDGDLVIYDGARPANPTVAVTTQNALVSFALAADSFGAAVGTTTGGTATLDAVTPVNAAAGGTASWFRIFDGNGDGYMDGTVTDTAGAGDLKVSSTTIVSGIEVSIVSLTFTQPKGWTG